MVLLEADPFLNELTKLYERNKTSGSVWVTMKRSTLKHQKKRKTIEESPAVEPEYRCLVRATDGKKTISCTLSAKDHQRFQTSYATVLKAHMDALKKREKKDKKSASTKAPDDKHTYKQDHNGTAWLIFVGQNISIPTQELLDEVDVEMKQEDLCLAPPSVSDGGGSETMPG